MSSGRHSAKSHRDPQHAELKKLCLPESVTAYLAVDEPELDEHFFGMPLQVIGI